MRRFLRAKFAGFVTVLLVLFAILLVVIFVIYSASLFSTLLAELVSVFIIYTSIAASDLASHSRVVCHELIAGDLFKARKAVGMIVGRDTSKLDEKEITRACVETVAENMVDGVTAPLFFAVLFSFLAIFIDVPQIWLAALGAMLYKGVNTMDSIFGYKNEKYLDFGATAAILDDYINYIPARLSGGALIIASFFLRLNWKNSWITFWRDRMNHSSPNAAHSEAAVAGALGVQLGGDSVYFGKIIKKPSIGDSIRDISPGDILIANRLMLASSLLFVFFLLIAKSILLILIS